MTVPKTCCLCISLRLGCIFGSIIYFLYVIEKIVALAIYDFDEGMQAIFCLNIALLALSGCLLLCGAILEERVSIITFLCFNVCALVIEMIGLLIMYTSHSIPVKTPLWIMVTTVMEYVPFILMIPVAVWEYRLLKEKHPYIVGGFDKTPDAASVSHPISGF